MPWCSWRCCQGGCATWPSVNWGSDGSRAPLQRLRVEFVERSAATRRIEDTARVVQTVRQGWAVVFFPEGTFGREPGLRPFHMGAFVVAAQAGVPVVPLALRGTRALLRAEQWLPRRGAVRLTFGMPLMPQGRTGRQRSRCGRRRVRRSCVIAANLI